MSLTSGTFRPSTDSTDVGSFYSIDPNDKVVVFDFKENGKPFTILYLLNPAPKSIEELNTGGYANLPNGSIALLQTTPPMIATKGGKHGEFNGEWFLDLTKGEGGSSGGGVVELTYDELATAISESTLTPGQWYRITDYQTVHTIPETSDTNEADIEPLTVLATSASTLAPEAYSETWSGDVIYYSPENNQDVVPGCTKGHIYRRVDTLGNNDIGFDWRSVKFRRWELDITAWDSETTYAKNDVVRVGSVIYISSKNTNTDDPAITGWVVFPFANGQHVAAQQNWYLDGRVFTTNENYTDFLMFSAGMASVHGNIFDLADKDNYNNIITSSNTVFLGDYVQSNRVGQNYSFNTIGDNFYSNTIGINFQYNTIGNSFDSNTIGNGFNYNIIGDGFNRNTIGDNFYSNTIGDGFYSNTIGINFRYNTIGDNFYSNTIGINFQYNTIGDGFNSNTIGNGFDANTIGDNFQNNTIGNNFNTNTIGDGFNSNTVSHNLSFLDFTLATHVYQFYSCQILRSNEGPVKLVYLDSVTSLFVIVGPTA
jgi:hypothetical protein